MAAMRSLVTPTTRRRTRTRSPGGLRNPRLCSARRRPKCSRRGMPQGDGPPPKCLRRGTVQGGGPPSPAARIRRRRRCSAARTSRRSASPTCG
eukprot:925482-Prorocentrum_minimum.AAC.3